MVQRGNPTAVGLHLLLRAKGLHGLHLLCLHASDVYQMRAMHQRRARLVKAQVHRSGQLHKTPQCRQRTSLMIGVRLMQSGHQQQICLMCLHIVSNALHQLWGTAQVTIRQMPKIQGIATQHSGSGLAFYLALDNLALGLTTGEYDHLSVYAALGPQRQKSCATKHLIVGMRCQQDRPVKLL